MGTYRNKLFAAASVVVAAGTVAVSGLAPASASQAASSVAKPAASLSASGTEHFQLVTASTTFHRVRVIADGVFTASGVDIISNTSDTLTFRGGAFRLIHSPGHGKQSFDPRTCLLTVKQHGTYRLSHGTGSYAGIRGHGRYVLSLLAIAARNPKGNCSQTMQPVASQQIIRAHGPVHR